MSTTRTSTATPVGAEHEPIFGVAIIGSGFAGLGMATRLKRAGEESFVVLERAHDIGGTWRDNTYPGAACDIQSHLYSYSFRPNPNWSRIYASQPEIFDYLKQTAEQERLLPHLRFDTDVLDAAWNDDGFWALTTTSGTYNARVLVSASGHLSDPKLPAIDGLESFRGEIFHSARWNHGAELAGARVGVIGSGASAIQIVPAIAPEVGHLTVFQRSAPYVIPRLDREYSDAERGMFARLPETAQELRDELYWSNEARFPQRRGVEAFVAKIRATALAHLSAQVVDEGLRAELTPDYQIGCKRILISNTYFPTFARENVTLETTGIERVTEDAVVMRDGSRHKLDVLILSTGFEATDLPIAHRIRGRGGRLLADAWENGEEAYACSTVNGFPNLFIMNGPNSGLGAGSIIFIVECQITYILEALQYMREHEVATLEISAEAEEAFALDIESRARGTVWLSGGCSSWYVDPRNGRLTTIWPDFMSRFRAENGHFRPAGYLEERGTGASPSAPHPVSRTASTLLEEKR